MDRDENGCKENGTKRIQSRVISVTFDTDSKLDKSRKFKIKSLKIKFKLNKIKLIK